METARCAPARVERAGIFLMLQSGAGRHRLPKYCIGELSLISARDRIQILGSGHRVGGGTESVSEPQLL